MVAESRNVRMYTPDCTVCHIHELQFTHEFISDSSYIHFKIILNIQKWSDLFGVQHVTPLPFFI
jgi:hypothetical protein